MTIKTPAEIAYNVTEWFKQDQDTFTREEMQGRIVAAIEADRAQREVTFEALDNLLAAWQNYGGDVFAFMQAWLEHLNNGTEIAGEFSA